MTTCLVTGGNGFIGTYLIKELSDRGYDVIVYGQFARKNPLFESLIQNRSNIKSIIGDITDHKSINLACKNVDTIFHLAATVENDPHKTLSINVQGTLNILEVAKQQNIRKVIFTSSSSVYFPAKYFPIDEEHPTSPNSYYAISKIVGELYCKYYNEKYNIDTTIFRLASVYGKRMEISYPEKSISIFFKAINKDETITIYGNGDQYRDYVYVDDVVEAFINAMNINLSENIINIGCGEKISIMDLAQTLIKISGKTIHLKTITESNNSSVQDNYVLDISKAKRLLNFRPTPLEEGLRNLWKYND